MICVGITSFYRINTNHPNEFHYRIIFNVDTITKIQFNRYIIAQEFIIFVLVPVCTSDSFSIKILVIFIRTYYKNEAHFGTYQHVVKIHEFEINAHNYGTVVISMRKIRQNTESDKES